MYDDVKATRRIELMISAILRYGVLLSFAVILIGSLLLFAEGGADVSVRLSGTPTPHDPLTILAEVPRLQPKAIIDLGLMLLILIPIVHVATSAVAYLVDADYVYVGIAVIVLAVLIASFVLGRTG